MFESVLNQVKRNVVKSKFVAVDAGYKTPYICKCLLEQGIEPAMPYKRPMTKSGFMKKLANGRWKSPKFGPSGLYFEPNKYYIIFTNKKTLLNAYAKLKVSFFYNLSYPCG